MHRVSIRVAGPWLREAALPDDASHRPGCIASGTGPPPKRAISFLTAGFSCKLFGKQLWWSPDLPRYFAQTVTRIAIQPLEEAGHTNV